MPRPLKDPSVRQGHHRKTTRSTLHVITAEEAATLAIPELRPRNILKSGLKDGEYWEKTIEVAWQPSTMTWWISVWTSPMRKEFTGADEEGLQRLAVLVDNYWRNPTAANHSEIRLQEQKFGLSPLDRRRLEWTIEQTETAQAQGNTRRAKGTAKSSKAPTTNAATEDPRIHTA